MLCALSVGLKLVIDEREKTVSLALLECLW